MPLVLRIIAIICVIRVDLCVLALIISIKVHRRGCICIVDRGTAQTLTHILTYFLPIVERFVGELLNITERSVCIQFHVVVTIFLIDAVVVGAMVVVHVQEGTTRCDWSDRVYYQYHVPSKVGCDAS